MRRSSPGRRLVALVLLVALTGCYSYVPIEDGPPQVGDEVRVRLTEEGARSASAHDLRDDRIQALVLAGGSDSLTLRYRPLRRGDPVGDARRRDTLTVALDDLGSVERSRVDALKTGGMVVGVLGLMAGAVILAGSLESGGDFGDGGDGPRLQLRFPAP